jgi:Restriction endonuclease
VAPDGKKNPEAAWSQYQRRAARLFESLGLATVISERLQGARSVHEVDVTVRFTQFGINHLWVVECKDWSRSIPKERILTLQSLVGDVGADRGFLLCEKGFQSGATSAAHATNLTLSNVETLEKNARNDLLAARWESALLRSSGLGHRLDAFTARSVHAASNRVVLKSGMDADRFYWWTAHSRLWLNALVSARIDQFPAGYAYTDDGRAVHAAEDMDELLSGIEPLIDDMERWIEDEESRP